MRRRDDGRPLTERQRAVLELLGKGLTNAEISSVLGVSLETVKSHVRAVLEALGASNRTEAVALARESDHALADDFDARPAVATLPFEIIGTSGPRARVLARGLADDLVRLLCAWRWFPVIARASTERVGVAGGRRPRELGRRLDARYLVHGRVYANDGCWRLAVMVDDADEDRTVWADRFEIARGGLFDAQDAIAARVVGACFPTLVASEIWRARRTRTRSLSAWERAHRALWHVERRSPEDNALAHRLLDGLGPQDGAFLPAISARGLALFQDVLNGWCADIEDRRDRIRAEAERAVALWAEAPSGHMLRARTAMVVGDLAGALSHVEVATAIHPSHAEGHALAGQLLAMTGHCEEGLARMRHARRLSPNAYVAAMTIALFAAREYEEALALADRVLADRPSYVFPRIVAVAACVELGESRAAHVHARRLLQQYPQFRTQDMSRIYAQHEFGVGDRVLEALHAVGIPR